MGRARKRIYVNRRPRLPHSRSTQDFAEIEAGDTVEIRRLLLESTSVERQDPGEPSDDFQVIDVGASGTLASPVSGTRASRPP
jgi:hypothetical protein